QHLGHDGPDVLHPAEADLEHRETRLHEHHEAGGDHHPDRVGGDAGGLGRGRIVREGGGRDQRGERRGPQREQRSGSVSAQRSSLRDELPVGSGKPMGVQCGAPTCGLHESAAASSYPPHDDCPLARSYDVSRARQQDRNPGVIQEGVFMAMVTKSGSKTSAREVLERAKATGVEVVDVRFVDLIGTWQHFSLPLGQLDEGSFTEGLGFDGSSIRGFHTIDESDMLLIPDPESATIDPVLSHKTLFLICDVIDPITREPYTRDARLIAKKAEAFLVKSGIADVSYWGPEAEFYLFNSLRFDQNAHSGYYYIDSEEGIWNSGRNSEPNMAFRPRHKEGYFPVPPVD